MLRSIKTTDTDFAAYLIASGSTFRYEFAFECGRVKFQIDDVSDDQQMAYQDDKKPNVNAAQYKRWKNTLVDIAKHTAKSAGGE